MTFGEAWQRWLLINVIVLIFPPPATSFAFSESRTFFANKIYVERLQLCVVAGTGCGKKAADAWCRHVGYENAMSYRAASEDAQREREQLVGTGGLCAGDPCNGFHFVKCRRRAQQ